jgi:hypothetical protein
MRDSYVFNAPDRGTAVQWCRMGDGNIGMEDYIRKYVTQCPGAAVSLEVIVSNTPRLFNYRDPQAWAIFQTTPAWEFARFLSLCERGVPRELPPPGQGRGGGGGGGGRGQAQPGAGAPQAGQPAPAGRGGGQPNPDAQRINREHVEASLQWTRDLLAKL